MAIPRANARVALSDGGVVVGIAALGALLSRPWTGFNSPDSEFYASYAVFGGDVADRSIDPAYTWTRLGVIAPTRLLVSALGPWWGFGIWRFLLILGFVGGIYALVRLASTTRLAAVVSLLAGLNTVALSYFGNTYLTGAIIALTSLLLAIVAWGWLRAPGAAGAHGLLGLPWPALLGGGLLGWLAMVNPYGMLLALAMAAAVRTVGFATSGVRGARALLAELGGWAAGFSAAFAAFWLAGLAIFPGRSWLGTYLEWNGRLDYASFVGDWTTWQRDTALLVVVLSVLAALISLLAARSRWSWAALAIAVANVAFTAAFMAVEPGPWLESPTYVALLWPGALGALGLSVAALVGQRAVGWPALALAVAAVPLMAWAGRWDRDLPLGWAWAVLAVLALAFAGVASLERRGFAGLALAAVGWLVLASLAGQVLQNGRGFLGTYGQFPFRAAYVDFDTRLLMESRIAAQEFVLAQTEPGDRIGIWTDPARMTSGLAAMQLWGAYNNVGANDVLLPAEADRLAELRPTAVAMYAPTREPIIRFWSSLPGWTAAQPPVCTEVPYLGIGSPTAMVCVSRLLG